MKKKFKVTPAILADYYEIDRNYVSFLDALLNPQRDSKNHRVYNPATAFSLDPEFARQYVQDALENYRMEKARREEEKADSGPENAS